MEFFGGTNNYQTQKIISTKNSPEQKKMISTNAMRQPKQARSSLKAQKEIRIGPRSDLSHSKLSARQASGRREWNCDGTETGELRGEKRGGRVSPWMEPDPPSNHAGGDIRTVAGWSWSELRQHNDTMSAGFFSVPIKKMQCFLTAGDWINGAWILRNLRKCHPSVEFKRRLEGKISLTKF